MIRIKKKEKVKHAAPPPPVPTVNVDVRFFYTSQKIQAYFNALFNFKFSFYGFRLQTV